MKDIINSQMIKMIEKYPCALATVMPDGNPNVIGIACLKVISPKEILITDNYMNQTIIDIINNPKSVLIVWNEKMNGYKFIGKSKYYTSGKWLQKVKKMSVNQGFPTKGAIVFTYNKIIKTA